MTQLKAAIKRKVAGKARVSTLQLTQGTRQGSTAQQALELGSTPGSSHVSREVDEGDVLFEVLRRSAGKLDRRRNKGHGGLPTEPKGFA